MTKRLGYLSGSLSDSLPSRMVLMLLVTLAPSSMAFADIAYVFTPINGDPTGINNLGQIVGFNAGGPFLRNANGSVQSLNIPAVSIGGYGSLGYSSGSGSRPPWPTVGLAINDLGEIVGNTGLGRSGAFVLEPNGTTTSIPNTNNAIITGINDSDQISGWVSPLSPTCVGGFIAPCGLIGNVNGTFTLFSADFETYGLGINNLGQVVGQTQNVEDGFLRQVNGTVSLYSGPMPGGFVSLNAGLGINDLGMISGASSDNGGPPFADGYIWQNGAILDRVDYPGATYTFLTGINDSGEIIGVYSGPNGSGGFLATPGVPEPHSWILLGTILILLVVAIRRKHSSGAEPQNL